MAREWSDIEIINIRRSIILVYFYALLKYREKLKASILFLNFSDYLKAIREKFRKWQQRFVHIHGDEEIYDQFDRIDPFAIEIDWEENLEETFHENESEESEDFEEETYVQRERRRGRIVDLRKNITQMVVLGPPGIGKTTTLQFLANIDAKNLLTHPAILHKIPIYV